MFTHIRALRDALAASQLSTHAVAQYTRIEHEDIECVLIGLIPLPVQTLRELLGPTGFVYTDRLLAHPALLLADRLPLNLALAVTDRLYAGAPVGWLQQAMEVNAEQAARAHEEMLSWWIDEWSHLLAEGVEQMIEAMLSYSERGRALRECSPLLGVLSDDEHLEVVAISQEQGVGWTDDPLSMLHQRWLAAQSR